MSRPNSFAWLKRFMPSSLYGRAALILLLPILTIQLVVSIAFIQRYFTSVTKQMAASIVLEIRQIDDELRQAPSTQEGWVAARDLAEGLAMRIGPATTETTDQRAFLDLSGAALTKVLREGLSDLRSVDLTGDTSVVVTIANPAGDYTLRFDRRRTTARNPHQLLVILLGISGMMAIISFIFLRNQLRPIRRLANAAEAFGRGRSVPYRISGASEVRAAGAAFLDMRARIERQREQRTLMLSGVSHDLRTPLTRLRLGLAMLGDSEEIAALERDVDDMRRMIDGFLAFARTDALEEEPVILDPSDLARQAVEDARRAGGNVVLGTVEGQGKATMRPMAVRRALDNLIGNGVTYGNSVCLSVTILEKSVRFTVEDDGPGIPEASREEALKPFTRLVPGRNQGKTPGVGLGLAITADIARSHGGQLRLGESARMGGLKAELVLSR